MRFPFVAETILSDFRFALRLLAKRPLSACIVVLTLAIGIGANSAIFSVANEVLLQPLPYPNARNLMMISETDNDISNRMISYPNFVDWRQRDQLCDSMSTVRDFDMALTEGANGPGVVTPKLVAADYFKVLGTKPVIGRAFTLEDEKARARVAVISRTFWRQHFGGDPKAMGAEISLNRVSFSVIGVMPDSSPALLSAPIWLLIGGDWGAFNWGRDHRSERTAGFVIARTKPGVEIDQIQEEMDSIAAALFREHAIENAGGGHVKVMRLQDSLTGNVRPGLLLLCGSVILLLLIASANVASLLLTRGVSRKQDMAIRSALGASRMQLIRPALAESLILSAGSGLAGLMFAFGMLRLFGALNYRMGLGISGFEINPRVMIFGSSLSLLAGSVLGLLSAWYESKSDLSALMADSGRTATGGIRLRLRNRIVIMEVALALTLLIGAGLMIRSFARLKQSPLGFDPHFVSALDLNLPYGRYNKRAERNGFYRQLLDKVAALPGVESASISSTKPGFADRLQNDIFPEDHPPLRPGEIINIDWDPVSEGYFSTMKIPILQGRSFTKEEVDGGRPVVVVDEALARRFWPGKDALGKWIKYDSPEKHEIIGIVPDVKQFGSKLTPLIKVYTPLGRSQISQSELLIRTSATDSRSLIPAVAEAVHNLDQDIPVDRFGTMEGALAEVAAPSKFYTYLIACFTLMATVLAVFGLYGVISYLVAERTREIGIRMAIGASRAQVVVYVMMSGLKLTSIGTVIGLAMSLGLTRLLKGVLYGVGPTDPLSFVAGVILFSLFASLGCLAPALKAVRVDPARALQYR